MANRDNGSRDRSPPADSGLTVEEIVALLDAEGEPPLDVEEEDGILDFKAFLRSEKAGKAGGRSASSGGKMRWRRGPVPLRLEGLEDRTPSAFPMTAHPLAVSLASMAAGPSMAILSVGMPDGGSSWGMHSGHTARSVERSRPDTGVVDHCFSSRSFLAEVRPSRHNPDHHGAWRSEVLPIDQAFVADRFDPAAASQGQGAGPILPDVGAVVLLSGLRFETGRGRSQQGASQRRGAMGRPVQESA